MIKPKAWWIIQKFGKLRIQQASDLDPKSKRKKMFICECGKKKLMSVYDVTSGKTVSCSKCNEMSSDWWSRQKFGRLRLKTPRLLNTWSHKKELWICDCGKDRLIVVKDVTSGKTVSCAKCNEMSPEWWSAQIFGRLRLKRPRLLNKFYRKKEIFVCSCGSETLHDVCSVTNGSVRSCGKCTIIIQDWFEKNRSALSSLKTPIQMGALPPGGPKALETITRVDRAFRALCPHCGNEYGPRYGQIKMGRSLTCGCSAGMVSGPNIEIQQFLQSSGFDAELEHKLSGYRYDIHIKQCRTLIEFQGSRYHRTDQAKTRDKKKKALAEVYGYELIQVEELVWRRRKEDEKKRILNVLRSRKNIGYSHRCKNEILAKIEELDILRTHGLPTKIEEYVSSRRDSLMKEMKSANEDIVSATISAHHVMCAVKNMSPDEAFGNDPFVYYGLGLVGEAGELTGALLRVIRNGGSHEDKRTAVEEELADCLIYAIVLAYATGIDVVRIVSEKAKKVEARARSGYYGPPLR